MRNNPSASSVGIKPNQADGIFVVTDSDGHDSEFYFLELVAIMKYTKKLIKRLPLKQKFCLWKFVNFGENEQ